MHFIRRAALDLLARREHSTAELLGKLSNKGFAEAEVQTVLAALAAEGLLSDQRFTEAFIDYRRRMGYGPLHIQMALKTRGIEQDLIDHCLDMAADSWLHAAKQVWQKRFKGRLPSDYKTRAQQMRFLQYRGFTQHQINHLFREK